MPSKYVNVVPMIAAVSVSAYCAWPYVDMHEPPCVEPPEPPRIEAHLLRPSLEEPAERNPFVSDLDPPAAARPEPAREIAAARSRAPAPANAARSAPGSVPSDSTRQASGAGGVLGATLIQGSRKAAVIDGRVYLLGERIAWADNPSEVVRLVKVERDRVCLRAEPSQREIVLAHPPIPRAAGVGTRNPSTLAARASRAELPTSSATASRSNPE